MEDFDILIEALQSIYFGEIKGDEICDMDGTPLFKIVKNDGNTRSLKIVDESINPKAKRLKEMLKDDVAIDYPIENN